MIFAANIAMKHNPDIGQPIPFVSGKHGGIYENYDAATAYLQSHLNTEYVIKSGPREEILELPEEALREALLNAMAHRDYRATSHIQVNIYRDRVFPTPVGMNRGG